MQTIFSHLPGLLKISAQASILIVLVLAIQWLCGRRLQPRWRCALWLLVLLRLALPCSVVSRASVYNVVKLPGSPPAVAIATPGNEPSASETPFLPLAQPKTHIPWLAWIWAAGALGLIGSAIVNHYKIHRRVAPCRPFIDADTLNLLEDCKAVMGVNAPVTLIETDALDSPSLFGFVRPRLLLPAGLASSFSQEELRHVFLHELAHVKRHDIAVGWLMLILQALHWFNPLVWLAFYRLRADRELACDALALSFGQTGENERYGLTMVKLLEGFGRSVWAPSLAGILENKQHTKERITMIAKFNKKDRGLALAVALIAGLALVTLTDAQTSGTPAAKEESGPPQIVATSPAVGATDVDPSLTEITVTFDRDMQTGYSWTGSGPYYPPSPEPGAKPKWLNRRTCTLPVKLETGRYYRVGINSKSYNSFRSISGTPANPSAIYFTTQGASKALKQKLLAPQVVNMEPANGSRDVNPSITELRVTFNIPMGGGFSWCGGGDDYPTSPEGKRPYWTADHKTCVLPVELKPNWSYELSLNAARFRNFTSEGGVALEPVLYKFKTAGQ